MASVDYFSINIDILFVAESNYIKPKMIVKSMEVCVFDGFDISQLKL